MITNAAGVDIAADIAAVKAETANIVADTNELQTDNIPGTLTTIEGKIDTVDGVADAILEDTGTTLPATLSGMDTKLDTIDNFLDTEIAAILEDTGTTIPGLIAALENLSAAEVNAEVVDALNVDTYSEPGQGAPADTPTIRQMMHYLYKEWKNQVIVDSDNNRKDVYNSAGDTVDHRATASDDGTITTKGKMGSGA